MVIDMELKRDKNGRAIIDDELFELFTRYINQGDNRDAVSYTHLSLRYHYILEGVYLFTKVIILHKGVTIMGTVSEYFGSLVFDDRVMKATLPEKDVYKRQVSVIPVTRISQVQSAVIIGMRTASS